MKNYFAFDCNIARKPDGQRNFRFLFKSPGALRQGDLSDAIEESAASILAPDGIAVVCIDDEFEKLVASFRSEPGLKQAAERLGTRVTLCVCKLDQAGQIILKGSPRNPSAGDASRMLQNSSMIFEAGLEHLFTRHHVLVTAPPGFTFVKPSGERSTTFLRAEDALTDVENVQFLSYALLYRLKVRQDQLQRPIDVICIDTMAMASVAYALRDLYCALYDAPKPRVVSFHSHEGLANFDFPVFGTSFCIISASSSMRLERVWRERSQCHASEVVTLLTFKSAPKAAQALFTLTGGLPETTEQNSLRDIRMAGERFAPEDLKPRKVLLRKERHKSIDAERFSKAFTGGTVVVIQGRLPTAGAKTRTIFVDGSRLADNIAFQQFLTKVLYQKVPASVSAIICQDDSASQIIANQCKNFLCNKLAASNALPIIPHADLQTRAAEINRTGALLIIASVVGRGSKLLSISRDLRSIHTGARTYVIGAQISETQAQISSLAGNLRYSAEGATILVEYFSKIAIGDTLAASYRREHEVLALLGLGEAKTTLAHRKEKVIGTSSGMSHDPLLPCGSEMTSNLMLRADFAYWDFAYAGLKFNTPAVLATAAAMLQNARESTTLDPLNRLDSDAFQQVVLDPENFARYNDGAIQGALLRAALPSELDYSSEPECSRYMFDLVSKIIVQHDQPQGEAASEFALALRTGALKLAQEHQAALVPFVAPSLVGATPLKQLLRLLLGIDVPVVEAALPEEF